MGGGKKSLLATVALAAAGCAADDGKLDVRTIADPIAAASKRGSPMLAEARGMLALNNVGLALEAFRKALRQQPDSVEALAGIAECYERMGRYDLSRVNYEAALAIAPNNPVLLNTFALSLQRQGRFAEASALRAEAAEAEAVDVAVTVRMAQSDLAAQPAAPAAVAQGPRPVDVAKVAAAQPAKVASAPVPVARAAPASRTAALAPSNVEIIHTEIVGNTEWTIEMPKVATPTMASVSVEVPLARPEPVQSAPSAAVVASEKLARAEAIAVARATPPAPAPKPAAPAPEKPARVEAAVVAEAKTQTTPAIPTAPMPRQPTRSEITVLSSPEPRLQRLSMGEVALLTRDGPAWRTEVVAQTRRSVTARFVPLNNAAADEPRIATARFVPLKTAMAANRPNFRLLNAARRQGLAARTRMALMDRGWRKIAIGDAGRVRSRSVVLYPANREALGKRLAAQFGFASALNRRSDEVLVLLGRDAPALTFRRARG